MFQGNQSYEEAMTMDDPWDLCIFVEDEGRFVGCYMMV